jgi:ubiquinone/menaquinone biosynthesis C-methylase UbiE
MREKIITKTDVKKHYLNKELVKNYIDSRFNTPLGLVLHKNHVCEVNKLLSIVKPKEVLEVACGPARVTSEISGIKNGTAIDTSEQMLREAVRRMKKISNEFSNWKFEKLNALKLTKTYPRKRFGIIYTFRFLRHFNENDRKKLFIEFRNILRKDGYLIFDAPNKRVEKLVRKIVGHDKYTVYDHLWDKDELISELAINGFYNIKLIPNIRHFWVQGAFSKSLSLMGLKTLSIKIVLFFEKVGYKGNPYEWVVICQKK